MTRNVAALFVQRDGVYAGLDFVDPWDEARDARLYAGPWPVVAHPPCERWGRFWYGGPSSPVRKLKGDDGGCFAAALAAVRRWGGVLEHPEASGAWRHFGLNAPPRSGGWVAADFEGGWTCCVDQGHYGHRAQKATWLYAVGVELPSLRWGKSPPVVLPARSVASALARGGRLSRVGGTAVMSQRQRAATPEPFRDLLLGTARTARIRSVA